MLGRSLSDELQPGQALLGRLKQVGAAAIQLDGESAHLADRLGGTLEVLAVVLHGPVRAEPATGLFIGKEGHREVTRRLASRARHIGEHSQHHGVHILHVHGTATPDQTVHFLAAERVHLPVARCRWDDVGVAMQYKPGARAVMPRDPQQHVGAPRSRLHQDRVIARVGQLCHHILGCRPLPRPRAVAVVGGIDPDEFAADANGLDLGEGRRCRRHRGVRGAHSRPRRSRSGVMSESRPRSSR